MSGRWKGIILNLMVPGAGFMAQGRWGWGLFYFLIGLALALPTFLIGTIIVAIISSIHSGVWGDAPRKDAFTDKDIRRLAEFGATQKETTSSNPSDVATQLEKLAKLKEQGIITEEEFQAQKKKVLGT